MKKHYSFPLKTFSLEQIENSNLCKVKLKIAHDGINRNGSNISLDTLVNAESSIYYTPIVAYIDKTIEDFGEHEIEIKNYFDKKGNFCRKRYYLERPIGVIPKDCNYTIEEIDGVNWVIAYGYIWKHYTNEALEYLEESESKGISMEIKVQEDHVDDEGQYHIDKFEYLGITVLGDKITPAMSEEATIELFSSKENNDEFISSLEKINEEIKKFTNNEVNSLSVNKETDSKVKDLEPITPETNEDPQATNFSVTEESTPEVEPESVEVTETENVENIENEESSEQNFSTENEGEVENTEPVVEEESTSETEGAVDETDKEKTFSVENEGKTSNSLSISYIENEIDKILSQYEIEVKSYWDSTILNTVKQYYRVETYPDRCLVIVNDSSDNCYYGINYHVEKDVISLDLSTKRPFINTWREKEENEEIQVFSIVTDSVLEEGKKKIEALEEELESLKTFKAKIDTEKRVEEVEEIIAKFSTLEDEEISELKEKACSFELDNDSLEKELFALVGRKALEEKEQQFSTKASANNKTIKVQDKVSVQTTPTGKYSKYFN